MKGTHYLVRLFISMAPEFLKFSFLILGLDKLQLMYKICKHSAVKILGTL